jgi:micrococcal nuclease
MFTYSAIVRKVIDGDTIDVDIDLGFGVWLYKQRLRFKGIDTPESRTRDKEEKKYGLISKKFVNSFCHVGERITIKTFKDKKGKFGRVLADVLVYDIDGDREILLTELMIEKGYGVRYEGQSKSSIEMQHLENRKIIIERGY